MTDGYCPDCGNYGRVHGRVQDVSEGPLRDCRYKGIDMRKWSAESIDAMLRQEAPHADDCSYLEEDAVEPLGTRVSPNAHCTCWKVDAL